MGDRLESFNKFRKTLLETPSELTLESFRAQIRTCQSISLKDKKNTLTDDESINTVVKICGELLAWLRTDTEAVNVDLHFLCSKTLYNFVNILPQEEKWKILEEIYSFLCDFSRRKDEELTEWKRQIDIMENANNSNPDLTAMSLIHGYFHTNMLSEEFTVQNNCQEFLKIALHITLKSCMMYSNNTLISFKNLNIILKKVIESQMENCIATDVRMALSYVILYNWENPLTGIKDVNLEVLSSYINLLSDSVEQYLSDVMKFPWNRAKYFTLCALIPYLKSKRISYTALYPQLLQGLSYSLQNPSFVSAGSDLYKVLIQQIDIFNQWYDIFYDFFMKILNGKDHTTKTNLLNHWASTTFKRFPALLSIFVNSFLEGSLSEDAKYSFLFILKLGRKCGQILSDWRSESSSVLLLKAHVKEALTHMDDDIRMEAIQIVCNLSKNNELPSSEEYRLVREFFINNANHDSASFRQNSLNCFTSFLVRIRDSFLHTSRQYAAQNSDINMESHKFAFEDFFKWLHKFIIDNLQDQTTNYQRKITSLEMLDVILRYLFSGYLDKQIQFSMCRKSNQRHQGWKLVEFMKIKRKWFFEDKICIDTLWKCINYETNDIRQSAVNILTQYYLDNPFLLMKKNDMFIHALIFCNSQKFYEVESGYTTFKLLSKLNDCSNINDIALLMSSNGTPIDILDFLIDKAIQQYIFQKEDILYSICNNQPLHGLISGINTFIANSNKVVVCDTLNNILALLKDVAKLFVEAFAIKSAKQYPPSFAEMNESVEHIVKTSKCTLDNSAEINPQLSDAQRLVENNIWLNLKACCELSSTLIISSCHSLNEEEMKACLELNIYVLTKCRHKGVIESAGVTLGQSVKYLTSLKKKSYNSFISNTLEKVLVDATHSNATNRSVTRKSAGLTILVHRIVSNDSQDRKPLFYLTMNILLRVLNENTDESSIDTPNIADNSVKDFNDTEKSIDDIAKDADEEMKNGDDISRNSDDTEHDHPMATALHILCRTVMESSLNNYVIQYASQLLVACFRHFSSENWQIRNGALQLYGALVPKLIGQKSNNNTEFATESSMSANELFSHLPGAWQYIVKSLRRSFNYKIPRETFHNHSSLIPLLGLLSNMAKRYTLDQFTFYPNSNVIFVADVDEMFQYLFNLLGSPIYTVRNLTAKALKFLHPVQMFYDHLMSSKPSLGSENAINGYLLLLKHYVDYYSSLRDYTSDEQMDSIIIKLESIARIMPVQKSYFSKCLHLQISYGINMNKDKTDDIEDISKALVLIESMGDWMKLENGVHSWLKEKIYRSIDNCPEKELCEIVGRLLNSFDLCIDGLLEALKKRLIKNMPSNPAVLKQLIKLLLNVFIEKCRCVHEDMSILLYEMTLNAPIDVIKTFDSETLKRLLLLLNEKDVLYNNGHLLPLCCLIISKKFILTSNGDNLNMVLDITERTKRLSNYKDHSDQDVRMMAAVSLRFLANIASHMIDRPPANGLIINDVKCNILATMFWLLQDEDYQVRREAAMAMFSHEKVPEHPYKKLRNILTQDFIRYYFKNVNALAMSFLSELLREIMKIDEVPEDEISKKREMENPFDHKTKNIHLEQRRIQHSITGLLTHFNSQ